MTANAYVEDARVCLDVGMNAHLGKPLEMDKVVSTIAACCGKANTKKLPRPWGSFFDCI